MSSVTEIRVIARSGASVDVEGPVSGMEVTVILAAATGQETPAIVAAAETITRNRAKNRAKDEKRKVRP